MTNFQREMLICTKMFGLSECIYVSHLAKWQGVSQRAIHNSARALAKAGKAELCYDYGDKMYYIDFSNCWGEIKQAPYSLD